MEVQRYVQTKSIYPPRVWRVYVNRTFGGNRHCCTIDGDIDAGPAAGKETGQGGGVQGQSA